MWKCDEILFTKDGLFSFQAKAGTIWLIGQLINGSIQLEPNGTIWNLRGFSSGQLGISIPSAFWSFDGSACRCRVCWRHGLCYPLPRFAPLFSFHHFSRDIGRRPHFRSIITPDEIDLMWCPNNPLGSILSSRIGHQMCIVKRSNSTLWNATNGDWKRQRHFNVYVGKLLNENR